MEATTLLATLQTAAPGVDVEPAPSVDLQGTIFVPRDAVLVVLRALRDTPSLAFACLADVAAADFWPREPRFELTYLLISLEHASRLRVKVRLAGDAASVASATTLWPSANWLEREVWDLFGIVFDGHPDPRRLLMPEDWDGFPLRKDYPVQVNLPAHSSQPLQMSEEEFRANLMKDRLSRG